MRIGVVGLYHLGEIYSACLAELGNDLVGVDSDDNVVKNLNSAIPPLKEPGLEKTLKKNLHSGNLKYSTDYKELADSEIIWFTPDIPVDENDKADLNLLFKHIGKALPYIPQNSLIAVSSQLPAGTHQEIREFIKSKRGSLKYDYAYLPENLRLGEAVDSFMKPSRIVIGTDSEKQRKRLTLLFKKLGADIVTVSAPSAEMIKHATNAFLSTSLSFIYDIADICEAVGADVTEVSRGLRADERIGQKAYLDASAGFSGGHLGRDLQYLRKIAKANDIKLPVINSVVSKNQNRRKIIFQKMAPVMGSFKGKTITFYGITYKSGTPTLANSLPLMVARDALKLGSKINLCDPWVDAAEIPNKISSGNYRHYTDPYLAAKSSQAIICITPWNQLIQLDWEKVAKQMVGPKIFFDARNYFADYAGEIKKAGINYMGVGR